MEVIIGFLVLLLVQTLVAGGCLWLGLMVVGESGDIRAMFLAALIASLFGFIPWVGWLIAMGVLLFLISRWTTADMFPGGILIVFIARFFAVMFYILLAGWVRMG